MFVLDHLANCFAQITLSLGRQVPKMLISDGCLQPSRTLSEVCGNSLLHLAERLVLLSDHHNYIPEGYALLF